MQVNLTVFEQYWCGASGNSQLNVSYEYKQILQVGRDDILICHLNFPNNFYLDSVKWYKVKKKKILMMFSFLLFKTSGFFCCFFKFTFFLNNFICWLYWVFAAVWAFLWLWLQGIHSQCGPQASHCGGFSC